MKILMSKECRGAWKNTIYQNSGKKITALSLLRKLDP